MATEILAEVRVLLVEVACAGAAAVTLRSGRMRGYKHHTELDGALSIDQEGAGSQERRTSPCNNTYLYSSTYSDLRNRCVGGIRYAASA